MDKPTMKKELAVSYTTGNSIIGFYAGADAYEDVKEYGEIIDLGNGKFQMKVDARYDFKEVLEYMQNYG